MPEWIRNPAGGISTPYTEMSMDMKIGLNVQIMVRDE